MINTIITKTNGKNKVVDFRDNLVAANQNDYAMLHGVGGKDHAPNSTIRCAICDYTKGTGEKSVTVGVNISVDVIYRLYEASKRSSISRSQTQRIISSKGAEQIKGAVTELGNLYNNMKTTVKEPTLPEIAHIGSLMKSCLAEIKTSDSGAFEYHQDKVDTYRKTAEGKAPVTKLMITRQGLRPDGQVSNYPWYIKITNGIAPVVAQANGASTYDSKQLSVTGEAFINISDVDMFRMMHRIVSYIRVWENTICIPLVQKGLQQRAQEKLDAANAKN